ncbi:MAG: MerR family transcriptional regulator [Acidimicrobiales bacterium]
MGERSYLSIGDVLALLREEFPDVTISKIRFLESRGLLVPERTPSGYRKFYDHDVDRLRWILRQQREHFLPLKVIKGRLEGSETAGQAESLFDPVEQPPTDLADQTRQSLTALGPTNGSTHPSEGNRADPPPAVAAVATMQREQDRSRERVAPVRELGASGGQGTNVSSPQRHRAPAAHESAAEPPSRVAAPPLGDRSFRSEDTNKPPMDMESDTPLPPLTSTKGGASPGGTGREGAGGGAGAERVATGNFPAEPVVPASEVRAPAMPASSSGRSAAEFLGASLTAGELAHASGLSVAQVEELESFGLIEGRTVAGVHCFDEDSLVLAGIAAKFAGFGIEARHLRLFKHAAERQVSLYSQVVMPLLRQRNPQARSRAQEDLLQLAELGTAMQACFSRAAQRGLTGG